MVLEKGREIDKKYEDSRRSAQNKAAFLAIVKVLDDLVRDDLPYLRFINGGYRFWPGDAHKPNEKHSDKDGNPKLNDCVIGGIHYDGTVATTIVPNFNSHAFKIRESFYFKERKEWKHVDSKNEVTGLDFLREVKSFSGIPKILKDGKLAKDVAAAMAKQ
ncbi:hypothetical protein JNW90_23675 [Micromonospora sp. STR1s_5]|nr:hypothetical protein [Micromonospora sp. STR1s_5]